jgi:hypothetical protein
MLVQLVVTETPASMGRLALAVAAQSVAMMPQPIPLCIADVFTEKEIVYSSHLVVLTLQVPWSG